MKMNYPQRNRTRNPYHKFLGFLLALFVVGVILSIFLEGAIISAVAPLWRAENMLTARWTAASGFFSTRKSLLNENARLKEQLASLENELMSRSALLSEESRILVAFGREGLPPGIAAAVLSAPPSTPYDTLVLDAGEREGITLGSEVVLPEGPVLGIVSEVFGRTSKVRLLSSPGEKTDAVLERSGLRVILEGLGGGSFRIIVPRETVAVAGDRVLSADVFSRLLAVVEETKTEPTASFKEVLLRSPVNIFNIHFVIVRP